MSENKDENKEVDLDDFIKSLGEKRENDKVQATFKDYLAIIIAMFQVLLPLILILLGILIVLIYIRFR